VDLSSRVEPLSVPPARWINSKCSLAATCSEPWNSMCSNRCANPVRPSRSFAEPTWYQRFTATIGAVRSGEIVTSNPFSSREVWIGSAARGVAMDGSGRANGERHPDCGDWIQVIAMTHRIRIRRQVLLQLHDDVQFRPDCPEFFQRLRTQVEVNSGKHDKIPAVIATAS